MKTIYFLLTLPILAAFAACQSETPQENASPGRMLYAKAYLPGSEDTRSWITYGNPEDKTRAQISYGNPDHEKEIFMWDMAGFGNLGASDWIAVYNVSRLSQCPSEGVQLEIKKIDGRSAIFESLNDVSYDVEFKAGDLLFVNYWEASVKYGPDSIHYDDRNVLSISVGTESNKPQMVVKNPTSTSLAYMQSNLHMYDIVTIEEDDKIPDLHFRHLSAILRVSLRNETGHDIFPTKLEFEYPGTESFFNTTLYCSVDTTATNGSGLKIYEGDFHNGTPVYTDKIGTTINAKKETTDIGESIVNGDTYDLYITTVPRIANTQKGKNGLNINLIEEHQTNNENTYSITLDGFDAIIEAGKRYWFNLTAVEDEDGNRKLMLTNRWLADHPDAKPYYE